MQRLPEEYHRAVRRVVQWEFFQCRWARVPEQRRVYVQYAYVMLRERTQHLQNTSKQEICVKIHVNRLIVHIIYLQKTIFCLTLANSMFSSAMSVCRCMTDRMVSFAIFS